MATKKYDITKDFNHDLFDPRVSRDDIELDHVLQNAEGKTRTGLFSSGNVTGTELKDRIMKYARLDDDELKLDVGKITDAHDRLVDHAKDIKDGFKPSLKEHQVERHAEQAFSEADKVKKGLMKSRDQMSAVFDGATKKLEEFRDFHTEELRAAEASLKTSTDKVDIRKFFTAETEDLIDRLDNGKFAGKSELTKSELGDLKKHLNDFVRDTKGSISEQRKAFQQGIKDVEEELASKIAKIEEVSGKKYVPSNAVKTAEQQAAKAAEGAASTVGKSAGRMANFGESICFKNGALKGGSAIVGVIGGLKTGKDVLDKMTGKEDGAGWGQIVAEGAITGLALAHASHGR